MSRLKTLLTAVVAALLLTGALTAGAEARSGTPGAEAPTTPSGGPGASTAIVGGNLVSAKKYPWLMAIYYKGKFSCAGELIAPTKVLTAGHCGHRYTDRERVRVVQGRDDVRGSGGRTFRVRSVAVHPRFAFVHRRQIVRGDVAVLTLTAPVRHTKPIAFVGPGDGGVYRDGTKATILGWGSQGVGGPVGHLRKATVRTVSDARCRSAYGAYHLSTRDLVCAGNWTSGGVDACTHDSGGPLLIGGRIAGTVSGGVGCALARLPGTYARLTTFSQWISS
ncbi:S1 family peptidase [Streptomyces sp. NPDC003233]